MKTLANACRLAALSAPAVLLTTGAAEAAVDPETAYILNSFSFLVHGFLVMFMAAGFAMLESGLVRSKNTAAICLKNMALYSIAGLAFYLVGYHLMYADVGSTGGWIGVPGLFYNASGAELALINAEGPARAAATAAVLADSAHASMSDWFFQMVFVATAASIVSGTLAERIRVLPFLVFVVVLSAVIYPIQGSWVWGGGWLGEMGFSDFAGSTLVHSTGGWAALAGALVLGARRGRYGPGGRVNPLPGANLPLATLGAFVLWFGWFGFNGGSQLALGSALDVAAMAIVYVNTNIAAAAGVVVAMALARALYGKMDLTLCLNGAIGGLVAITAGPDLQHHALAAAVGGVGGALVVLTVPLLDRLRIDDVVGAIPAHLVCGVWGTLAVGMFGGGSFLVQLLGVAAVGVFVFAVSGVVWLALARTAGIRVDGEQELGGIDRSELGLEAYPEFGRGSVIG